MPVLLITDALVLGILLLALLYAFHVRRHPHLRANWSLIFQRPSAMVSALVLSVFVLLAVLDSIHYRPALNAVAGQAQRYAADPVSFLDQALKPLADARERSYSAPLAANGFRKESIERDGKTFRDYPRLQFGGAHLANPEAQRAQDIRTRTWSRTARRTPGMRC